MRPSERPQIPEPGNSQLGGLTLAAAAELLDQFGPNELPATPPTRLWRRIVDQLRNAIVAILLVALVFDLAVWMLEGATQ
ncbi:MAG: cation-transporting P-type ATPase, partial [Acidimicrobiales bacterium]